METVRDLNFWGSKITADGECSHEIKRCLLVPWKKCYDQSSSILKRRDIALQTEVHLVKAMVFPVIMYGCESSTIKKVEHRRIDAFELWCRRRLLRVPWTARRSNQSILKEISLEYSLEGLMLKLQLQYFGHLMWRCWSWNFNTLATWCEELTHWKWPWCWERLKVGGGGNDRGWDGWIASPAQRIWIWVSSVSWWWTGKPAVVQSMGLQRVRQDWAIELNWTESMKCLGDNYVFGILWWNIHSWNEIEYEY